MNSSYDAGYAFGQFVFGVGVPLIVLVGIGWGVIALIRSNKKPASFVVDASVLMRFALAPGETPGPVWPAFHTSGAPMMATITSRGIFALNYTIAQAPPVRLSPDGVVVTQGAHRMIAPGAAEPLVDVTVAAPGAEPMNFALAVSGATALAAWAAPSTSRSTP